MAVFKTPSWRKTILPLLLGGAILSCSPLNPFGLAQESLQIGQLAKVANKNKVQLQGKVVNLAPFLEGGAYELRDASGSVWVKTPRPLPKKGVTLMVTGEVVQQAMVVEATPLQESYLVELMQQTITTAPAVNPPSPSPSVIPSAIKIPVDRAQEPTPSVPPTVRSSPASASVDVIPAPPQPTKPQSSLNLDEQFLPHKRVK